jgi:hypothetical protein
MRKGGTLRDGGIGGGLGSLTCLLSCMWSHGIDSRGGSFLQEWYGTVEVDV